MKDNRTLRDKIVQSIRRNGGTSLHAGTGKALDAINALGESTDYREIDDAAVLAVCNGIDEGVIRCIDANWYTDDELLLKRLSTLARQSCEA